MGPEFQRGAASRAASLRPTQPGLRTRALTATASLAMLLGVALAGPTLSHAATASTARTFSLSESGRLHLTSHHSFTLNEQGSARARSRGPSTST